MIPVFRWVGSVSVDQAMAMRDMEDALPCRIACATTNAEETYNKSVEDSGHSRSSEQVRFSSFDFVLRCIV